MAGPQALAITLWLSGESLAGPERKYGIGGCVGRVDDHERVASGRRNEQAVVFEPIDGAAYFLACGVIVSGEVLGRKARA